MLHFFILYVWFFNCFSRACHDKGCYLRLVRVPDDFLKRIQITEG